MSRAVACPEVERRLIGAEHAARADETPARQVRGQSAGEACRDDEPGPVAVDQEPAGSRRPVDAGAGHDPGHAAAGHSAFVKRESAGERFGGVATADCKGIRLDGQCEHDARVAGSGALVVGRRICKSGHGFTRLAV